MTNELKTSYNTDTNTSDAEKSGIVEKKNLEDETNNVQLDEVNTVVSTKVVQQRCKSVRENADWYYG